MQFNKLRYFLKLMNALHTCNILGTIIVLMTVITIVNAATKDFYTIKENLQNVMELSNAAATTSKSKSASTSKMYETNTTHNVDDFEQILSAQLKREEEQQEQQRNENLTPKLKTQTGYTTNADYDTIAAGPARKSLLSRKRRYLLFPEGTSFQLVYDGIVGVVDYTNYLILGITLALAWELPTKPPSEQLEDIKKQAEDGTLFLPRNDTATNITYVDTKSKKNHKKFQNQNQYTNPNYINMADNQRSYYHKKPYNNYYNNNKRPLLQPLFIPPMHKNYYYERNNQSPSSYKSIKPAYSMKYDYYFQPNARRQDEKPYFYKNPGHSREHTGDWRFKYNNYYEHMSRKPTHPFKNWITSQAAYTPHDQTKYPWWNLATRLTNSFRKSAGATTATYQTRQFNIVNNANSNQQQEKQSSESGNLQSNAPSSSLTSTASISSSSSTSQSPSVASIPRKHHIYPVFGKRSLPDIYKRAQPAAATVKQPHYNQQKQQQHLEHRERRRCGIDSDELSKFDRIHIRHHRRTRHTLYEKIEKYLDKRGSHGHHCVLRALCETAKKSTEKVPGTFLGELMRTVFTLPEPVEEDLQKLEYKERRYDAAHAYEGNCAQRYFHCKDSLWESHFIA